MSHTVNAIRLAGLAHRIADRAVVCDIESEAHAHEDDAGRRWYDTRPMLDPNEHGPELIDMAREALAYAHERGLTSPHPEHAHLVRITKGAAC